MAVMPKCGSVHEPHQQVKGGSCRSGVVISIWIVSFLQEQENYRVHLFQISHNLNPVFRGEAGPGHRSTSVKMRPPQRWRELNGMRRWEKKANPSPKIHCFFFFSFGKSYLCWTPADRVLPHGMLLDVDRPGLGLLDDARLTGLAFGIGIPLFLCRRHGRRVAILRPPPPNVFEVDGLPNVRFAVSRAGRRVGVRRAFGSAGARVVGFAAVSVAVVCAGVAAVLELIVSHHPGL